MSPKQRLALQQEFQLQKLGKIFKFLSFNLQGTPNGNKWKASQYIGTPCRIVKLHVRSSLRSVESEVNRSGPGVDIRITYPPKI